MVVCENIFVSPKTVVIFGLKILDYFGSMLGLWQAMSSLCGAYGVRRLFVFH